MPATRIVAAGPDVDHALTSAMRPVPPACRPIMGSSCARLIRADRRGISNAKARFARRELWHGQSNPTDDRTVEIASQEMRTDLFDLLTAVGRRFPGKTLEVLYEGCGFSAIPEELEKKGVELGVAVRTTRTDIYTPKQFSDIVNSDHIRIRTDNYVQAAPEEIVEAMGEQRFHLILSVFGGMTYTALPKVKGLYSLCSSLAPGGVAYITTIEHHKVDIGTGHPPGIPLLPSSPSVSAFFKRNEGRLLAEDGMEQCFAGERGETVVNVYMGTVRITRELNGSLSTEGLPYFHVPRKKTAAI